MKFSSPPDTLVSKWSDITPDWPVDTETWFTHDVLPQRSELIDCHKDTILCISTKNMIKNAEHPISIPNLISILTDQSMCIIHYTIPCVMITDQRFNSSIQVNMQDPVITQRPQLPHLNLRLWKHSSLLSFPVFSPSFVRQSKRSLLSSILLICLIIVSSHSVKNYVQHLPFHLASELVVLGVLFICSFYVQPFGCSLVLHNTNIRDWFRTLAVP